MTVKQVWSVTIGVWLAMACLASAQPSKAAPQTPANAARLIAQSIAAMGGEARLTSLRSLTLDSIGHSWALEQSERPEGPWLSTYLQQKEVRDLEHQRRWVQAQRRDWSFPAWSPAVTLIIADDVAARTNGQRWAPGAPGDVRDMQDTFALAPERLLLTARAAGDLRVMPDEVQQMVLQHVLAFTRNGQRLRLLLNPWTHLPTMLEVVRDDTFGIWGDVVERRWYGFWTLEKGGLMYPRQTSVEWNGYTYSDETVQAMTVDGPIEEAQFAVPADTRAAYAAMPPRPSGLAAVQLDDTKAVAVTDWIVQLPGGFNVVLVHQPDGVVAIEATTSSQYSQAVIAAAAKRFPGAKIKAVVTTSDAWPHVGGIREYVAQEIPIYPLNLNVSLLTRLANAAHTFTPDTLARQPKAPIFKPVSERTVIGSGDTRIELLPVHGETGERAMIVWLPGAHVLYSSDLIQRSSRAGTGFFMPEMLAEVATAVEREHIAGIERVIGMHLAPTPWEDITRAIAAAKGGD